MSEWSCTRDRVTEPCGECDGCRYDQSTGANSPNDRTVTTPRDRGPEREAELERYRAALERIAAGRRPDGTYNLSREACEQIAKEALRDG